MEWITPFDDIGQLTQGSIVDGVVWGGEDNPVSIVLSNACDLEHNHASYLIVAALYPAVDIITASREYSGILSSSGNHDNVTSRQKKAIKSLLSNYIHHRTVNRFYFIDCRKSLLEMNMMVDFQQIQSIPIGNAKSLKPIAHLNSPLKEQMIMQFVSYTARIPSDRVSEQEEQQMISELLSDMTI